MFGPRRDRTVPSWHDVVDNALELTVVGSFSRLGFATRRRLFQWEDPPPSAMGGRTALVTGPTSGLGRELAGTLARLGARVVLVGRNRARLEAVATELAGDVGEERFPVVVADLASLASVRRAVDQIRATEPRLDVLIDNAGAIHDRRLESPDGIEAMLALLVVGPFALTAGLLPLLRASGDARVVAVTSGGMYTQAVDFDDLQWRRREWSGPRVYAQAKRIQVALTREWARRLPRAGIRFNAMHPGWADTPGLAASLPGFHRLMGPLLRSPAEGADTAVWLASAPEAGIPDGRLWLDRRPRPFDRAPVTRLSADDRRRLWAVAVELAGIEDPAPG